MEPIFNTEEFIGHQTLDLNFSFQELLDPDHEFVDFTQEVGDSFQVAGSFKKVAGSFKEVVDFSQELVGPSQELVNLSQELVDSSQELVKSSQELVDNKMHKGQDLVGVNGPLPRINKTIYGYQKGFVAIKIRNKTDNDGCLTNLYYKYEFGGTYQPKKTDNLQNQHNKGSKKVDCNWRINLLSATGMVRITSFNDCHVEHQLSPNTNIFAPANCRFSNDCHEEICHLVVNEHKVEGSDASYLLKQLYKCRDNDPNWYIELLIDSISNRLRRIFWMDPGQRERWTQFCDIIVQDNMAQTNYYNFPLCLYILVNNHNKTRIAAQALMSDETIESFHLAMKYIMAHDFPNTKHLFCLYHLSQKISKNLRSKLSKQYADFIKDFYLARNSLNKNVFETRFTNLLNKYPIVGMQSTQRVEGLNNLIKTAVNSSSTLLQVMEAIHQRIERESLNQPLEQQKQIIQSTLYRAQILDLWDSDNSLNLQETIFNIDFIENIYDISYSYLLALINENNYSSIKEDDMTEYEHAQEPFLSSNRNTKLAAITHQLNKKLQFNKSMSLAKKAIILQGDETKEREMRVLKENHNLKNVLTVETDNEQLISIDDVANSLRHVRKGAPKKTRLKGAQEDYQLTKKAKSSTRLCGFCHEPNYYQNTCPKKKSNMEM
ncbi:24451_t:CDS:10 [Gigaspora margarita]|uniref:24451_t:CDS:1 n=1 Tax=Gigaspora margarita TaxID=4874 RepID=A0ABN7VTS5_GIGMA|nr:24451_t:CDS:10 [Gigaspora margarita]